MSEDAQRALAWEIHELIFDGQRARDEKLLKRMVDGGKAVARYLAECEDRAEQTTPHARHRACKTAERMLRRGRSRSAARGFLDAQLPPVPTDPLDVLGHTTDPSLAAGILAAYHDWELSGERGTDMKPLPCIVPFSGREQAVHRDGRIAGRAFQDTPDSVKHVFAAFLLASLAGRDVAAVLQVRRHLDQLGKTLFAHVESEKLQASPQIPRIDPPGKKPEDKRSWTQLSVDNEIRKLIRDRSRKLNELGKAVVSQKEGAQKAWRDIFGRNTLAKKLGCSGAMISKSQPWKGIADPLGLTGRKPGVGRGNRVGLRIGEERAAGAGEPERRLLQEETDAAIDRDLEIQRLQAEQKAEEAADGVAARRVGRRA